MQKFAFLLALALALSLAACSAPPAVKPEGTKPAATQPTKPQATTPTEQLYPTGTHPVWWIPGADLSSAAGHYKCKLFVVDGRETDIAGMTMTLLATDFTVTQGGKTTTVGMLGSQTKVDGTLLVQFTSAEGNGEILYDPANRSALIHIFYFDAEGNRDPNHYAAFSK